MNFTILYEDGAVLVVDKPAEIVVFPEGKTTEGTLIDFLIQKYPELKEAGEAPRYGVVHRLDKNTSGILLIAKTSEALLFFQNQYKNRRVEKKYNCLVEGAIKDESGTLDTLLARSSNDSRKQTVYEKGPARGATGVAGGQAAPSSAREAVTEYKVLQRFEGYTLLEVTIKTGRKHQIRAHMAYLQHPVAGDTLYRFKNSKSPAGLTRQFLHAYYLKIKMPDGEAKEFHSELPEELKLVLNNLKIL